MSIVELELIVELPSVEFETIDPVIVVLSMVELSISDEEMVEHTLTIELSTDELSVTDELSEIVEESSIVEFSTV